MAKSFDILRLQLLRKKLLRELKERKQAESIKRFLVLAADTLLKNNVKTFSNERDFLKAGTLIKRAFVDEVTREELRILRGIIGHKLQSEIAKLLKEPRYKQFDPYWFDMVLTRVIDSL